VKATVQFLKVGHLLEQNHKGRFRLDTSDPGIGQVEEHRVEQEVLQLLALFGNGRYPDIGEEFPESAGGLHGKKRNGPSKMGRFT
jgi:hypothetical protein